MKKKLIIIIILIISVVAAGYGAYELFFKNKGDSSSSKVLYTCSMHPQIISDHPGQCPICGMDLIIKTDNKKDSLTEKNPLKLSDTTLNSVNLSPSQQVLANVQTEKVKTRQFSGEKTFNGYVKINEKNFAHIATPVSGRIEKMYVNFEGQIIRKGDPVIEIYSPELVSTQKEYLLALDNYNKISQSGNGFARDQAESLVKSARQRLSFWEFTSSQFENLEKTRQVMNTITIHSKYPGVITKKYVHVGHWAMAGEDIYDVADLSTIWVIGNVYESEVKYIKAGQLADIYSASFPNDRMVAKINYINPVFNSDTRTLEVRMDVANKDLKLKPDMYVKVKINTYAAQTIAVPKNAVIRAGERNFVYVEKEKGVYVPRQIQISYEQDGYYAVTSGLSEGEVVVSSGGFLIDSESQIQSGFSSGHEKHGSIPKSGDDNIKINPDQDIMKDMDMKK